MKQNNIINVLEWNLNFGSYDTAEPAKFVGNYIRRSDVAILTEVRANKALTDMINALGYDCIASEDFGEYTNQVVIAAKPEYGLKKISGRLIGADEGPDFLHGSIEVANEKVNIIGMRVRMADYPDRYEQVKLARKYISSVMGAVICTGDFNNGQIRGDEDAKYSEVADLYRFRGNSEKLSDLRFYNFHLIKDLFSEKLVIDEPTGEYSSWGLCKGKNGLIYGWGNRIKNDLLFHSRDIKKVSKSRYSWEHVRRNKKSYLEMIKRNSTRNGNKIDHGYPDHARLISELLIPCD